MDMKAIGSQIRQHAVGIKSTVWSMEIGGLFSVVSYLKQTFVVLGKEVSLCGPLPSDSGGEQPLRLMSNALWALGVSCCVLDTAKAKAFPGDAGLSFLAVRQHGMIDSKLCGL